ncbi:MAG TPA: hypothetical protein VMW76_09705 [Bacteroidales bacterium]|nr:hypothetical protein [Bacteroidales bacterium]
METMTKGKKLKLPAGILDGTLYGCMNEIQQFVFLMLLNKAVVSSTTPSFLIGYNYFDKFTAYNITPEDLSKTLRAMECHNLISILELESLRLFLVSIKNWQDYEIQ